MAKVIVGTEPIALPLKVGDTPVIQNLGPGTLYLDTSQSVSPDTGLRIKADSAYEWPGDITRRIWAVADAGDTDVRILRVG